MNLANRQDQSPRREGPRIYSGLQLPYPRAGSVHPNMMDSEYAGLIVAVLNALLNCNQIQFGDRGAVINIPSSGGGADIEGQWDSGKSYKKSAIVFFQPDGAPSAGTYYALQDVPPGIMPSTGAPYWADFPNSAPGSWL